MMSLQSLIFCSLLCQVVAFIAISLEVCQKTHRAHPKSETKFQMLDGKFWIEVDCGHLVWNQMLCRCTYKRGADRAACSDFVSGDKAGLYKRWNGLRWEEHDCNQFKNSNFLVWNQEKCRCDWETDKPLPMTEFPTTKQVSDNCHLMLNLTFDTGFNDEAHQSPLERQNPSESYLTSDDSNAIGQHAACFKDSPILAPYFSANSLSDTFHISLRFRICEQRSMDNRLQTLFHNSCFIEGEGVSGATIAMSFQAGSGMFLVDMDTKDSLIPLTDYCTTTIDSKQWNQVEMRYQDGVLSLVVNDKPCLNSKYFKGPVKRFKCPLIIPGEDFCGCLDEVLVTKGCRV